VTALQYVASSEGAEIPPHHFKAVLRIRIHLIHVFLGLQDPDPDPLIRGMDPDPDPSIAKQK
jgi:hypothetical protein